MLPWITDVAFALELVTRMTIPRDSLGDKGRAPQPLSRDNQLVGLALTPFNIFLMRDKEQDSRCMCNYSQMLRTVNSSRKSEFYFFQICYLCRRHAI